METWAIVVLVVGTNLVTALLALLGTKRQLEHSDKRLEKQLEAEREAVQRNRRWVVRSQPLLALREELARMTERIERVVGFAMQVPVIDGVPQESDENFKNAEKALEDWNAYIDSGEFYRVVHMQYEHKLKAEAHKILVDHHLAYSGVLAFWNRESTEKEIDGAKDAIKRNAKSVSALQLRINGLLEEL